MEHSTAPQQSPLSVERLKVAAQQRLSPSVLDSMQVDHWADVLTGELIAQISALVHAQRIADATVKSAVPVTFDFPLSPWQHWKHRHAGSWWLRWFTRWRPVRYSQQVQMASLTAHWTGWATFPDSTLVIEDARLGAPVFYLQLDRYTDVSAQYPG